MKFDSTLMLAAMAVSVSAAAIPQGHPHALEPKSAMPQGHPHALEPKSAMPQGHPHALEPKDAMPQGHAHALEPKSAMPQGHPHALEPKSAMPQGHPHALEPKSAQTKPFIGVEVPEKANGVEKRYVRSPRQFRLREQDDTDETVIRSIINEFDEEVVYF